MPGKQTDLVGFARAVSSYNNLGQMAVDTGYATVTVVKDTPDLGMRASQTIQTGGNVSVTATLEGTDPDGSLTFNLYGPTDPACAAAPIYSNTVSVDGNGSYPSPTVQASQAGAYRWKATYSGDEDNFTVTSSCLNPAAATLVDVAAPAPAAAAGDASAPAAAPAAARWWHRRHRWHRWHRWHGNGTGTEPGKGTLPGATVTKIKLDAFALTRKTFARLAKTTKLAATAAAVKKPAKKKKASPKGTTIKYKLSAPATVTMIVERITRRPQVGQEVRQDDCQEQEEEVLHALHEGRDDQAHAQDQGRQEDPVHGPRREQGARRRQLPDPRDGHGRRRQRRASSARRSSRSSSADRSDTA